MNIRRFARSRHRRSLWLMLFLVTGLYAEGVHANAVVGIPSPQDMGSRLKMPATEIRVIEPHLSVKDPTSITYRGWPAQLVLDVLLGKAWRNKGVDVEVRALDGYVSRIPSQRFDRYRAYFVSEMVGQRLFEVDNLEQNEKKIPLGPWYLVWDNTQSATLQAEGGTYWPYQATQLRISTERQKALMPPKLASSWQSASELTHQHCLSCHRANGFGGDKMPIDLAQVARAMPLKDFTQWVLSPTSIKPETTMPALQPRLAPHSRERSANDIHKYLRALNAATEGQSNR